MSETEEGLFVKVLQRELAGLRAELAAANDRHGKCSDKCAQIHSEIKGLKTLADAAKGMRDAAQAQVADLQVISRNERARAEAAEGLMRVLGEDKAAVRANLLRGSLARPDDLIFMHDTDGPYAKLEAKLAAAERDAARYRWLRTRINYIDKVRGTPGSATYKERVWQHMSYQFEADTLDAAIDNAAARREEK
jgi:hypothetical protein